MEDFICKCGHKLIYKSLHDGMCRFSTKVIKAKVDGSAVVAVCKSCNSEVDLPVAFLFFSEPLQKAEEKKTERQPRRCYVVEKKDS